MLIGYARVSMNDQHLDLQKDALKKASCKKLFTDVASGTKSDRPGLARAVEFARDGDTLVVWKLDRFGRSLAHLIEGVRQLQARGIGFRSLNESIDTTTSTGKLIFHVFGALAEFERDIIRERTKAGLASARARGRKGGRPRVLDGEKLALARSMYQDVNNSPRAICETLGISSATLYRYASTKRRAKPAPQASTATRRSPKVTKAKVAASGRR